MKDTNYINIQGWMINRLKLSGNSLIVYAVIYGFSQDGESKYTGSASYLAGCAGISKQTVLEILKRLTKDHLLVKTSRTENGVKFCDYSATVPGQETLPPPVKKTDHPGQETLPHIDLDIKRDKQRDKKTGNVSLVKKPPEDQQPESRRLESHPPGIQPPFDKPIETKEDAITIWNLARELWNSLGLKPICRNLMMRAKDTGEILLTFQTYSWAEIKNAIENYSWHKFKAGSDFRPPPPYGSLAGFLKIGVERYFDDNALDQQFKETRK
jgi:DNA-binding HxlR family transcriptional regulator